MNYCTKCASYSTAPRITWGVGSPTGTPKDGDLYVRLDS